MVMLVTSVPLQDQLDQWDHMNRFGMNTPEHFLVHDQDSLTDLFREWVEDKCLDKINFYKYERDSEEDREVLPASVGMLKDNVESLDTGGYYYLATPFVDVNEFIHVGYVKTPAIDDPFVIKFGIRDDHRIPYEDDEEYPCEVLEFDHRQSMPHPSPFIGDVRRIACGFPYQACRITFSITKNRIGRTNNNLCFYEYQVDPDYIRD